MTVASAEIHTTDGKLATLADTSAMLLPHRSRRTAPAPIDQTMDVEEAG